MKDYRLTEIKQTIRKIFLSRQNNRKCQMVKGKKKAWGYENIKFNLATYTILHEKNTSGFILL